MLSSTSNSGKWLGPPRGVCPVCESADVARSEINSLEFADNFYLQALRSDLGMPLEVIRDSTVVYECKQCATIYCDPWLRYELASDVYNVVYGQHNRGWDALFGWVAGKPIQYYGSIYETIQERVGGIYSYGEFICPFQGNLFCMRDLELGEVTKEELFDVSKQYLTARQQDSAMSSDPACKKALLANRAESAISKLRELNRKLRPSSVDRYLLYSATSLCWGHNCIGGGASCKSLASVMLNARVLTVLEAQKQKLTLDLMGVYNTLDHVTDPLSTLDNLLAMARYVLLINHAQPIITKQHHFVLRPGLSKFLRERRIVVEDLKNEAGFKSNERNTDKIVLLLSKQV